MALTSHKMVVGVVVVGVVVVGVVVVGVVGYGGGGVSKRTVLPQKQKPAALQRPSAGATT